MNQESPFKKYPQTFKGARFDVHTLQEGSHRYDVLIHPGGAVVLPILDDENIVMIKNERIAVGKILWELPAGTLEPDEETVVTAQRELEEETGYVSTHLVHLISFYTSPGISNEVIEAFVAKDLKLTKQNLDQREKISVEIVSLNKAIEMALSGELTSSPP